MEAASATGRVEQDAAKLFVPLAFAGTAVIFVDQASEIALAMASAPAGSDWRFQSAAFITSRLPALIIAATGAMWIAERFGRPFARRISVLAFIVAAVLFLLSGISLWVDGQALRATAPDAGRDGFLFRWIRVVVLSALGLLMCLWISIRAGRFGGKTIG